MRTSMVPGAALCCSCDDPENIDMNFHHLILSRAASLFRFTSSASMFGSSQQITLAQQCPGTIASQLSLLACPISLLACPMLGHMCDFLGGCATQSECTARQTRLVHPGTSVRSMSSPVDARATACKKKKERRPVQAAKPPCTHKSDKLAYGDDLYTSMCILNQQTSSWDKVIDVDHRGFVVGEYT